MVAKEMNSNIQTPQNNLVLKSITAIGVSLFTGFMMMSWNHTLSQVKLAEQTQETATTPVETEPVAVNTTPTVSQLPETPTATNSSVTPSVETTSVAPTAITTLEAEITDPELLKVLNQKLYNQVDQAWQTSPTFSDNLVYQVKVQENGEIADYSPLNQAAVQHLSEVPIDTLQDKKSGDVAAKVAKFLVVLTPSGSLQVNPWIAN